MEELNRERLASLLGGELPGSGAQYRMAPEARLGPTQPEDCNEAAVMLLLYPDEGDLRIVFIKRNEYEGPHSGQISFPGGMKEQDDSDLQWTSLRETREETGADVTRDNIIGGLTPLYIPVSNFCVHPFVGWLDSTPVFRPDETEVQYLVCPTLSALLNPDNRKTGSFNRGGTVMETPYFDVEGEMVWGATAMIFSEFMALIGY